MNSRVYACMLGLGLMGIGRAETGIPPGAACLIKAYPQDICGFEGNELVFCDGTRLLYVVKPGVPEEPQGIRETDSLADLEDQMSQVYPKGPLRGAVRGNPGRLRYEPFFQKLYGSDSQAVSAQAVSLRWPDPQGEQVIQVSGRQGIPDKLTRIAQKLLSMDPTLIRYFKPIGGSMIWRMIQGTSRLSMHSFGIAVDLRQLYADYWRWDFDKRGKLSSTMPPNRIPEAIVLAFEEEGFIWGGKWQRYDTMHFEYRPELFCQP